jgi:mannose-6-phosphate isomerase-like protein (cupin superfamily)
MERIPLVTHSGSKSLKAGRIILEVGEEVGEHVTENREEVIVVLKGEGILLKEKGNLPIKEGDAHYIKEDTRHNVRNTSNRELEYVYIVNSTR